MCKLIWLMLLTVVLAATTFGQSQPPVIEVLDGLDPILLAQGKETQGELNITVTRGRFKYLFANAENKTTFEQDPARYEIQLNGSCARMGAPVRGNPNLFTVHQGRIYIFGSETCKKLFEATPAKYLESGTEKHAATPAALQKGQSLIAKAVAAMGGATRVDALTSYHEKYISWQQRQVGAVEVKNDLLFAFPDRIRLAQEMPDYRDPAKLMQQTLIFTTAEAFGIGGPRGVFPLEQAYRTAQEQELKRRPLHLLRARQSAGFKAIALGAGKAGETAIEQVAIESDNGNYVLGIDPTTGRILSLARQQRGPDGSFGQLVQLFADFRTIEGLTLPFKITATFDGQPWQEQSATIGTVTINGAIDPKLFEKPKVEKPQ